jgi:phage baseplate assembly protein gpV
MRKFSRIFATVLVVLALTVVIAPAVARAASVPGDVYYVPGSGTTVIVLSIGSQTVIINGVETTVNSAPEIKSGHTFVPIRSIVEGMGGTIAWNATTHAVTIKLGNKTIVLTIGSRYAVVNGERILLDTDPSVVPYISNGRTMLPIRFIAEQLGALVVWNATLHQVTLVFVNH